MIARLLYAAVALCILGTRPEHAASAAPAPDALATASSPASACPNPARGGIGSAPVDFAIPPNSR